MYKRQVPLDITNGQYIRVFPYQSNGNSLIWFREIQLVAGTHTGKWLPALEDSYKDINLIASRVATVEETLTTDSIVQRVIESTSFSDVLSEYATVENLGEFASLDELQKNIAELQQEMKENIDNIDFTPFVQGTEFQEYKDRMNMQFLAAGGVNLLRNSLGINSFEGWETSYASEIQIVGSAAFDPYRFASGFYFPPSTVSRYISPVSYTHLTLPTMAVV